MTTFLVLLIGILIGMNLSSNTKSSFYIGYEKGYNDHPYDADVAYQEYLEGDYE